MGCGLSLQNFLFLLNFYFPLCWLKRTVFALSFLFFFFFCFCFLVIWHSDFIPGCRIETSSPTAFYLFIVGSNKIEFFFLFLMVLPRFLFAKKQNALWHGFDFSDKWEKRWKGHFFFFIFFAQHISILFFSFVFADNFIKGSILATGNVGWSLIVVINQFFFFFFDFWLLFFMLKVLLLFIYLSLWLPLLWGKFLKSIFRTNQMYILFIYFYFLVCSFSF